MKVLSIFGTRPEAVKMAPVIQELARRPGQIDHRICVTAQHREMLDQVLTLFGIVPHHDLNIMRAGQSLTQATAAILAGLEPVLQQESPDWVLVQGDTTTVMAAALAAFYAGARVGHIEAGLRTFDRRNPFPEEINRKIAGVVADLHFAPTAQARQNLLAEGIPAESILVTGNPVIDALHQVAALPYAWASGPLASLPRDRRLILVTAHRRENFGAPLAEICRALHDIAVAYPETVQIVFPVHLNPNVQASVRSSLADVPNITLLPPLDYLPLVQLMQACTLVLTDSGGIQEEAPGLGKPVLVLRDTTERPEAVDAGTVRMVGADHTAIVEWTRRLLDDPAIYAGMAHAVNPYGDGHAAVRIVDGLLNAPSCLLPAVRQ